MSRYYKYIIYFAATFSLLLGIIVLFGWYTHNVSLIQVNPAFVPMQYNTALGFFICGAGLIAVCFNYTRTGMVCGALVLAIGGITLLEYVFALDLFLDQLFMEHYVTTKTSHPGRMAPNTALCFSLSGITLLAATWRNISRKPLIVSIIGALILGLGLISMLGYFIHAEETYGWGRLTKMAIHTAVGFIVLGIGFSSLSARIERALAQVDQDLSRFKIQIKSYLLLLMTSTIIFVLISLGIFRIIDDFESNNTFQKEAKHLIAEIKFLDEVLTSTTMLATESGELSWQQRYDDNAIRLDEALNRIKSLAPAKLVEDLVNNTEVSNHHLFRMETEAFENITFGKQAEAHAIIQSDDYLNNKQQYTRGINNFISGIDDFILASEKEYKTISYRILFISIIGLFLLPAIWVYIIINQIRIARDSRELYGSMESMVAERTTELEKSTDILNQQKGFIEETIENMDQGIVMTDEDLKILAHNTRFSELTNMSKDMVDNFRDYEDLLHYFYGTEMNFSPEKVREVIELSRVKEKRVYILDRPDGRILEVRHIPKKNGGYVRIFNDVSEREKTKREMAEQKAIIEKTMDNIDQGIIMFDKDMKVLAYNNKYSNIMDIPVDVMQSLETYDQFIRYTREVVLGTPEVTEEIVESAKSDQFNTTYINFPNDKTIEVQHFPIKEGGAVRTFTDVTEKENARTELEIRIKDLADARRASLNMMQDAEALRLKAEAATDAKANFLAAMSHEIRTPMNGIIGMVDLLRQSNVSDEHSHMLQTISDSGQSLLTIINDILDFSKIEAGKLDIEKIEFSIMEVLESSAETIKANAAQKGLNLITYVDPRIPQFVMGDPVRIRQILINLTGNAIKFTDKGHVTIRADLQETDGDDVSIHFRIIDQGIGISEEGQKKLFQAFSQAETSTTRKYGGTGLGLSICQRLTEMMHGEIGVESELGKGSEFYLTIGFNKSDKKINVDSVSDLSGLNMMVVSQNETDRFVCRQYLEYWHANITEIDDILELVDQAELCLKQEKPLDIIVLCSDWEQEQQFAIREAFKKEEKLKDIKFVLLMKGRRTKPRLDNPETVQFDVGPMRRVTFLTAVSIAAGRASPEVFHEEQTENFKTTNITLSVDEAIKQNALILVAEDNPTNRDVISRQLKVLGYTCELADDGKEALAAWRSNRYAILLTDCHMPEMDGYDLTGEIRKDEKAESSERAPIVAITANALQGEAERCLAAGMDDYMSKPINMHELRSKLIRWMPQFKPMQDSDNTESVTPDKTPGATVDKDKKKDTDAIDTSALIEMFGDDPEMIKEILTDFIQPSRDIIEEIKLAYKAHSAEGIKQAAHKLKSSARSVGANELADLCAELEAAGKEDEWALINKNVPDIDSLMVDVENYINNLSD